MASILVVNDILAQARWLFNEFSCIECSCLATLLPTALSTNPPCLGRTSPTARVWCSLSASLMAWRCGRSRQSWPDIFGNASQIQQFVNWYRHWPTDTFWWWTLLHGDQPIGVYWAGFRLCHSYARTGCPSRYAPVWIPMEAYSWAGLDAELVKTQEDALEILLIFESVHNSWVITGIGSDDQIGWGGFLGSNSREVWLSAQDCHLFGTETSSLLLPSLPGKWSISRRCHSTEGRAVETRIGQPSDSSSQELLLSALFTFYQQT